MADKGWNELANRIGKSEFNKLDHIFGGFAYRIPPPGAVIKQNQLHANTTYPSLTIHYSTDGSEPDPSSPIYMNPIEIEPGTKIKLRAFNKVGRGSRTTNLEN